VNLVPYLTGEQKSPPHETLFWRFVEHGAIRHGNWKLTMPADKPEGLYDLSKDISESNDLSRELPGILSDLKERFAKWNAELPPPLKARRPAATPKT
jgi:arylsulfatase A-like enzyme